MSITSRLMAKANAALATLMQPPKIALTADAATEAIQAVAKMYGIQCRIEKLGERKLRVELALPTTDLLTEKTLDSVEIVIITEGDKPAET